MSDNTTFDDLTRIKGINRDRAIYFDGNVPRYLGETAEYANYEMLSRCSGYDFAQMLSVEASNLNSTLIDSWSKQAKLAAAGKWDELKTYQASLPDWKDDGDLDASQTEETGSQGGVVEQGKPVMGIKGIDPDTAEKLQQNGVTGPESLLRAAGDPASRRLLAKETGIDEKAILEWVNRADLMRVKGIGIEYSNMLEEAGVDTVKELARRNPDNLHTALVEANENQEWVQAVPALSKVKDWVEQAKSLKPAVAH